MMTLIGNFHAMDGLKVPIFINQGFMMTLIIYQSGVHDDPDWLLSCPGWLKSYFNAMGG